MARRTDVAIVAAERLKRRAERTIVAVLTGFMNSRLQAME
jgi:hypothetical protein